MMKSYCSDSAATRTGSYRPYCAKHDKEQHILQFARKKLLFVHKAWHKCIDCAKMLKEDEHRKGNKYTAKKSKTGGKNKVKRKKKQ
jgi:hypothetical protein